MAYGKVESPKKGHNVDDEILDREDNCWICDAWIEGNITVNLNKIPAIKHLFKPPEDPEQPIQVYLHCDFDDY